MSYFVLCEVATVPCPSESQTLVAEPDLEAFAAVGLTPADATAAIGIGFGIVFMLAMPGYVLALVLGLIRKT